VIFGKDEKTRWEEAQKNEELHHRKHSIKYKNREERRNHFSKFLKERFQLDFGFFEGKDVLEVGCGTTGMIYYLDEAKSRIGIEPMNIDSIIEDWQKQFVKKGIGEEIPFEKNSFDIVLVLNSLDHVLNPEKVIKECHRVLRKEGQLFVHVEVLSPKAIFFRPLLNRFDRPHPYHFITKEYLNMLSTFDLIYQMEKKDTFSRPNYFHERILNFLFQELHLIMKKQSC